MRIKKLLIYCDRDADCSRLVRLVSDKPRTEANRCLGSASKFLSERGIGSVYTPLYDPDGDGHSKLDHVAAMLDGVVYSKQITFSTVLMDIALQ